VSGPKELNNEAITGRESMLVKNWMSRDVITIEKDASMRIAVKLLERHHIRSLPVMQKEQLVGILSISDIKRASASDASSLEIHELMYLIEKIQIKEIMTKNPVTVDFHQTVDEVAELLLDKNISGAPVIDQENHLAGIITRSDILKVMISMTGANRKGIDFGFEVEDEPGSIKEITDTIRFYKGRLASIMISYRNAPVGSRHVYIRIYHVDRDRIEELKDIMFHRFKVLYILDYLEASREVF
jgi:acetoin utilization protein AcuB